MLFLVIDGKCPAPLEMVVLLVLQLEQDLYSSTVSRMFMCLGLSYSLKQAQHPCRMGLFSADRSQNDHGYCCWRYLWRNPIVLQRYDATHTFTDLKSIKSVWVQNGFKTKEATASPQNMHVYTFFKYAYTFVCYTVYDILWYWFSLDAPGRCGPECPCIIIIFFVMY